MRAAFVVRLEASPPSISRKHLLRALSDVDSGVRIAALNVAARKRLLARALIAAAHKDASPLVRAAAIRAMGRWGDRRFHQILRGLLGHSESTLRRAAAVALCTIGDLRHQPDVMKMLYDGSLSVRIAVMRALHRWPSSNWLTRIRLLILAPELAIRIEAISIAATRRDRLALRSLLVRLPVAGPGEKRMLLFALGEIGGVKDTRAIRRLMFSRDGSVSSAAINAIGKLRDATSIPQLIKLLTFARAGQFFAATALQRIGRPSIAPVLDVMRRTRSPAVKRRALRILVHLNARQAVPAMLAALHHHAGRTWLLKALRKLAGPRAVRPLLRILPQLSAADWRRAVLAIGACGGGSAVRALILLLKKQTTFDRKRKRWLIEALGLTKARRAMFVLCDHLKRAPEPFPTPILLSMLRLGRPVVCKAVLASLGSANRNRRFLAGAVLRQARDRQLMRSLLELSNSRFYLGRYDAARAVAELAKWFQLKGLEALARRWIGSSDPRFQQYGTVLAANAKLGPLIGLIASRYSRWAVAQQRLAIESITELYDKSDSARKIVLNGLSDRNFQLRTLAAWACGRHLIFDCIPMLRKLGRGDANWEVRANAIGALAEYRLPADIALFRSVFLSNNVVLRANAAYGLNRHATGCDLFRRSRATVSVLRRELLRGRLRCAETAGQRTTLTLQLTQAMLARKTKNGGGTIVCLGLTKKPLKGEPYVVFFQRGPAKVSFTDADGVARNWTPNLAASWYFPSKRF